jgi:hypothetical protein
VVRTVIVRGRRHGAIDRTATVVDRTAEVIDGLTVVVG